MLQSDELPEELNISLGSENREFAVKGAFAQPVIASVFRILFGAGWLGFTFLLMSFFIDPGFFKEAIESFTSPEAADTVEGEIIYYVFIIVFFGIFLSVGFYKFFKGIFSLFQSGGYFIGTPTRLVNFRKGKLKSCDWEQFTSDIVVKGDNKKGNITLVMKTGRIVRSKNSSMFVPDYIYILGIEGALDIEQICRKRIRENDPNILS
jgi:hypothetical protein